MHVPCHLCLVACIMHITNRMINQSVVYWHCQHSMRQRLCNGTVSVCLSHLLTAAAAYLLLWARRAEVSTTAAQPTLSSNCEQHHAVSWRRKLNTDLFHCKSAVLVITYKSNYTYIILTAHENEPNNTNYKKYVSLVKQSILCVMWSYHSLMLNTCVWYLLVTWLTDMKLSSILPIGADGNDVLSKVNGCSTVENTLFLNSFSSNVTFWQHNNTAL